MCRLFGFRSVIPSQVHRSLLVAENALGVQSNAHPDGWGVAYYVNGAPHVTRSPETALGDVIFHRLSGVVSSETVLAHVRKATRGPKTVLNCHPFQYGRWVFAHNGDIPNFEACRERLLEQVDARLRRFILGETDSEVVFFIFLSELLKSKKLIERRTVQEAVTALRSALHAVRAVCDDGNGERALLTVMATDGETLVAAHGGKELFWSSHKTRCADRGTCANLSPECEAPSRTGRVNHLIVSSEPLLGENVWQPLADGDILGIDWRMHYVRARLDHAALPLA
ncbi:MAG TPA: class II glutamine amidotransferase [Polyangiaceae bacterium]|nr:class II glutamine amidotransferase [Polyangiaceae bacterium]